jgi:hypothetical protein
MRRRRGVSGLGLAVPAVALLALAGGCDSAPASQAGGPPGGSTPAASSAAAAPGATPSGPAATSTPAPIPSYTAPPGRSLARPPGVGRVSGSACDAALSDEHFYEVAWFSGYASYVQAGDPVPSSQWATGPRVLPAFLGGVPKSRAALQSAGVPRGYPAYRDLADLDAAMRAGIAAAKARTDATVLPVYFRLKTAHDHLLESCGVLE